MWCIAEITPQYRERMYRLLDLYQEGYDPARPVVCIDEKINIGTMIRYLGEICWFPAAALNDYITWEEINELSAKATLTVNGDEVSGIFQFSDEGDFTSFEAERYYGGGKEAKLHTWVVEAVDHKTFDAYRVPNKLTVTWKLPEGDFTWLHVKITELDVNRYEPYP